MPLLRRTSSRSDAAPEHPSPPSPRRKWLSALLLTVELLPALLLAIMYLSAREREWRAKPWQFAAPHSKIRLLRWLPDSSALELASGKLQPVYRPDELRNDTPLPNTYPSLDESRLSNARKFRWSLRNSSSQEDGQPQTLEGVRTYTADGTSYATSNYTPQIHLYDVSTGRVQRTVTASARVLSLAFSPDGSLLAVGTENRAEVWDVQTGALRLTLRTQDRVTRVRFSPHGTWIGALGEQEFRVWNAATGQPYHRFNNAQFGQLVAFAFSPDESTFALRGINDNTLLLANMRTGAKHLLHSAGFRVWDVAFSPDGQWLASTSEDSISLWDARTATLRRTLKPLASTALSSSTHLEPIDPEADKDFFNVVEFSPDSCHLAAQTELGKVVLWRLR